MSNTSIKVALALVAALTFQTATSAGHAVSAALKKVQTTTIDRSSPRECGQRSPAVAPTRPDNSVCWAPVDDTDWLGV